MNIAARLVGTFLGVGYFPAAPGTVATAVGVAVVFYLGPNPAAYTAVLLGLLAAGVVCSSHLERVLQEKDPGIIVVDEVVGIMIALAGLPLSWPVVISGFFLFRAFDMFKIYPINRLEGIAGGWGIMLDDCMAGIYSNIVLSFALRWAGLI